MENSILTTQELKEILLRKEEDSIDLLRNMVNAALSKMNASETKIKLPKSITMRVRKKILAELRRAGYEAYLEDDLFRFDPTYLRIKIK